MKDISELSSDERKRFYAELGQNAEFKKNRKMLVTTTLMAAACLIVVGLMVMNNLISMWLVLVELVLIVVFYMYFAFRAVIRKNEITEHFRSSWGKKPKAKAKRR